MTTTIVLWALVALVAAFFWYSHYVEPRRLGLTRLRVSIPRLPEALEGLTLLHLSDLHVTGDRDDFGGEMARRAVALAEEVPADLICLTGDISQASRAIDVAAEILRPLTSRPVFVVMGNHDHDKMLETELALRRIRRVPADEWCATLEATGARVLRNEHVSIELRGCTVIIAGCGDPSCGWDDLPQTLAGKPRGDFHLLLVHSPDMMDSPDTAWADLVLCGHTHGGQLRLPGIGSPWAPVWRDRHRAYGLLRFGTTLCYVTRGVAAGFRSRFLCPPEVVEIVLTRGPGDPAREMQRHKVTDQA
ncbi:MAG: metallophosphoesterase [Armatimonadetes bacterium]|nr:metallophosphoesterase [Armatimonadota bacterium]